MNIAVRYSYHSDMSLPAADLVDLLADVLLRHQGSTGCGPDCICKELHELPRVNRAIHRRQLEREAAGMTLSELAEAHGLQVAYVAEVICPGHGFYRLATARP